MSLLQQELDLSSGMRHDRGVPRKMTRFANGLLLQTTGHLKTTFDSKMYQLTGERHQRNFSSFSDLIRKTYPDSLCLGAGPCQVCKTCAYPNPCRFPDRALSSMEAYGLFVIHVCKEAGLPTTTEKTPLLILLVFFIMTQSLLRACIRVKRFTRLILRLSNK